MKTLKNSAFAVLSAITLLFLAGISQPVAAQPGVSVSFQLFYDELAPYGEWINDPEYGYVWIPDAGSDFRPYANNGHWVMTSYGNTWVSDYDWGWAPFHYGRWRHTDYYGWAWVPGYEWGPAWVSWRNGGGYYGWAPLMPGAGINISVNIPSFSWVFVPQRYICSPNVYRYYTPHRNVVNIYNRTTIINNTYVYNNRTYVSGPRRSDLERVTKSRIAVRDIQNSSRPGRASVSARSVNIYRPNVDRSTRTSARPSRVADVKTISANRTATGTRNTRNNSSVRPSAESRGSTTARPAVKRETGNVRSSSQPATSPARPSVERVSPSRPASATRSKTENRRAPAARSNTSSRGSQPASSAQPSSSVRSSGNSRSSAPAVKAASSSRSSSATRSRPSVQRTEAKSSAARSSSSRSASAKETGARSARGAR